jgi:type II secretory pathway component PulM
MLKLVSILSVIKYQYGLEGMKKLFGSLGKKGQNMSMDHESMENEIFQEKKAPLTKQQKLMILGGVGIVSILVFQLFIINNQKEIQARQNALQLHIEDQSSTIRNTLSEIIHAEAEQVRKSADEKITELKQMILNSNTEALTQLQQLQMKLDEVQKQTKSLDKVSDELVQKFSAKLQQIPATQGSDGKANNTLIMSVTNLNVDKVATNYRIYSANSYGLVLQAENGTFTIATIGKELPKLGEITSITANEVVAGNYKIITDPRGFTVNKTDAISAYQ